VCISCVNVLLLPVVLHQQDLDETNAGKTDEQGSFNTGEKTNNILIMSSSSAIDSLRGSRFKIP
jgi:hypothetical protein